MTVTATSSYTLTHTLSGTNASSFDIIAATGQIKVKSGTSLDYETKKTYSVVVTVRAAEAGVNAASLDPNAPGSYIVPVTINVTDVNEPPTLPTPPNGGTSLARSVAENSAAGTKVGAPVSATDGDGDTIYYSLAGTDADSFDIGLNTGQISVATGTNLDHEAKATYSVTVQVSDRLDGDDNADTEIDGTVAVTISVTDVNEPPTAPDGPTVAQNVTPPKTQLDVSMGRARHDRQARRQRL